MPLMARPSVANWLPQVCLAMLVLVHSGKVQGIGISTIAGAAQNAAANVAGAVGLGPSSAPAPGPTAESPLAGGGSYTALGDSYSAGVGAGDLSDGDCQQAASQAWPTLLAQQLGIPPGQFTLAACSGYTSVDVLNKELGSLSPATTLITLTAGGNDAGVEPTLAQCVEPDAPPQNDCAAAVNQSQQAITMLGGSLDTLYQRIRQLAPNARVFVVSYPDVVPDQDCQADSDLSEGDIEGLKSLINPLDEQIQSAVTRAGAGFTFVDVRPVWMGHMVCSDSAWANGVEATDPSGSYHPNADGQNAYKQTVLQAISASAPAPAPASSAY